MQYAIPKFGDKRKVDEIIAVLKMMDFDEDGDVSKEEFEYFVEGVLGGKGDVVRLR